MSSRQTRQRDAIRQVFEAHDRPLGVEELLRLAKASVPALGQATLYRTLKLLREEGLIVEVPMPGGRVFFERAGKSHHHHFLCSECGRAFDIPGCLLGQAPVLADGHQISTHEVVLYGKCRGCAAPASGAG